MVHIMNTLGPKHESPYGNISVKDEELFYDGFDQGYDAGVKDGRRSVYNQSLYATIKAAIQFKITDLVRKYGNKASY